MCSKSRERTNKGIFLKNDPWGLDIPQELWYTFYTSEWGFYFCARFLREAKYKMEVPISCE